MGKETRDGLWEHRVMDVQQGLPYLEYYSQRDRDNNNYTITNNHPASLCADFALINERQISTHLPSSPPLF